MPSWAETHETLARTAGRQLFFVGGAPRSGTTWLQHLLHSHPEVSCQGEASFMKHLPAPLARAVAEWRAGLEAKNATLFGPAGGYPLPPDSDADVLVATAILLALARQADAPAARAIGEKTPENVFHFAHFKQWFPGAKFIGIARDPRDVLTSAWHFFHRKSGPDDAAAKLAFVRGALPALQHGSVTMLDLLARHPGDAMVVTYEAMRAAPAPVAGEVFRFLGVRDTAEVVAECVARTSFAALSGGRAAGQGQDGAFFRKGVVGDWRTTLTAEMNEIILRDLGWMYPRFGWTP